MPVNSVISAVLGRIDPPGSAQSAGAVAHVGRGRARLRGAEEHGLDAIEIPLLEHPLHQYGAHHSTPADETYTHDRSRFKKMYAVRIMPTARPPP